VIRAVIEAAHTGAGDTARFSSRRSPRPSGFAITRGTKPPSDSAVSFGNNEPRVSRAQATNRSFSAVEDREHLSAIVAIPGFYEKPRTFARRFEVEDLASTWRPAGGKTRSPDRKNGKVEGEIGGHAWRRSR
jgi:hypothetical protein